MSEERIYYRYSLAFQQKVVSEIESGKFSIAQARRVYDIKSASTIYIWLRKLGKGHVINKVLRVQMKDEQDRIKVLEREKQKLESALAQAHLKNLCLEALIECVEEHYKLDVKKTFGQTASKKSSTE